MPVDATVAELAGLVAELREVASSLRATASALAETAGASQAEGDTRELARSAVREIDRARRRGQDAGASKGS